MIEYQRPEWINKAPAQYHDILEKHDMWLKNITAGERANLQGANLQEANLQGVNLWGVNLQGANLQEANLQRANLRGADLYKADLRGVNLREADLEGADLEGANLRGAQLQGADLRGAELQGADLQGVNLQGANLQRADLEGANLRGANLEPIKKDLFDVLLRAIPEIPLLKQAIIKGKIKGSTYEGECACLCGTIEKSGRFGEKCDMRDNLRPIERFFLAINVGDTPKNSQFSKLALEWIEEFEGHINVSRET